MTGRTFPSCSAANDVHFAVLCDADRGLVHCLDGQNADIKVFYLMRDACFMEFRMQLNTLL